MALTRITSLACAWLTITIGGCGLQSPNTPAPTLAHIQGQLLNPPANSDLSQHRVALVYYLSRPGDDFPRYEVVATASVSAEGHYRLVLSTAPEEALLDPASGLLGWDSNPDAHVAFAFVLAYLPGLETELVDVEAMEGPPFLRGGNESRILIFWDSPQEFTPPQAGNYLPQGPLKPGYNLALLDDNSVSFSQETLRIDISLQSSWSPKLISCLQEPRVQEIGPLNFSSENYPSAAELEDFECSNESACLLIENLSSSFLGALCSNQEIKALPGADRWPCEEQLCLQSTGEYCLRGFIYSCQAEQLLKTNRSCDPLLCEL